MSLGQSSKSSGERRSTETHKRLKIWQEQGWRWHACVLIMLDRSMLQIPDTPGIVGECLAIMAFECARYQVDVIAGDGNKACYFTTPKSPGVPTYQHSLLQHWINKMMNVATQARRKNHDRFCPPVRVKHLISCSYRDLDFPATHLDGITTARYTEELMNKTSDWGDCCMISIVEWGHSRLEYDEDIANLKMKITWTTLVSLPSGSMKLAWTMITTSSWLHLQIVMPIKPSDMLWSEKRQYIPSQM